MNKNFGIVEDIIELGAYVFGDSNIPRVPFQPDGNWEPFLPKYEPQAEDFETSGCTVWGSQNQIETFIKRVYGYEPNYSERFTYVLTGIKPEKGTDPQNTYECIRKHGLIPNQLLTVPRTIEEFTDTTKITPTMRRIGKEWLDKHDFKHEWLWGNIPPANYMEIIKEALPFGPLGVSVSAWNQSIDSAGNKVYVSNEGSVNNHFCMLYKIDKHGYPWVFDSYDHSKKRLSKDHTIRRAKLIFIQNRTPRGFRLYMKVLEELISKMKKRMDIATLCEQRLGTDVSPRDNAPDDLACAESVSTLLKEIYPETPIMTGTWTMYDYLRKPTSNWIQKDGPARNRIIISPTGLGKRGTHGHVGICLDENRIASNKSATGTLETHLTVQYWNEYYGKLNYPVLYFEHV